MGSIWILSLNFNPRKERSFWSLKFRVKSRIVLKLLIGFNKITLIKPEIAIKVFMKIPIISSGLESTVNICSFDPFLKRSFLKKSNFLIENLLNWPSFLNSYLTVQLMLLQLFEQTQPTKNQVISWRTELLHQLYLLGIGKFRVQLNLNLPM